MYDSQAQQRKTMSGHNALLSLLSQDDFVKLNKDIHNHIDKHINDIGGKIEEIAASEEEEDQIGIEVQVDQEEHHDDDE